ncbi:MAG: preprotein translocase subunit SecE [Eggerthellaceae bacterium]|jgi:preprotein translocase subunit SecE|uniref:Protein translocase subunit SecE n=1 Tax=Denitrobacterium detoxificans TaxID=79604 RepID=A0A172RZ40_9ACTN|nr:preprotein translocase subunit SecE [Denitrobacterium detoxificans]ANE22925.1 preprotein translocase subunit SecE [Denitrobacterium detoxificans]MBE6465845.1 preprotein translocase subunit SecE [Denitrobacterium detoxificans]MCR5582861.1 preprotein translocase subunit SecE [Eggerthellaceae bacterium]SEO71975.1 preprotein translocase subunit SecE [Denitrobacterium detoxificans]
MAKKSKTQRAKASARRAARKADVEQNAQVAAEDSTQEASSEEKKGLFKRSSRSSEEKSTKQASEAASKSSEKKPAKAPKKDGFFAGVRAEMKRVTWPTRQDVLRWSGVVVGALVFFGVYVFILDNWIVTPLLVAISSLGA